MDKGKLLDSKVENHQMIVKIREAQLTRAGNLAMDNAESKEEFENTKLALLQAMNDLADAQIAAWNVGNKGDA